MPRPLPDALRQLGRPRINRAPSPLLAGLTPWVVVMLGSLSPIWPLLSPAPLMPPLGFLFLIAWQQVRPRLFPIWAGLPLGLFDDLYSGQPFGSAVLLWSITMLALDILEVRFPWRGFLHNWLAASGLIALYLASALHLANLAGGNTPLAVIAPQIALSILAYPIVARLAGAFDRLRLIPIRKL